MRARLSVTIMYSAAVLLCIVKERERDGDGC